MFFATGRLHGPADKPIMTTFMSRHFTKKFILLPTNLLFIGSTLPLLKCDIFVLRRGREITMSTHSESNSTFSFPSYNLYIWRPLCRKFLALVKFHFGPTLSHLCYKLIFLPLNYIGILNRKLLFDYTI